MLKCSISNNEEEELKSPTNSKKRMTKINDKRKPCLLIENAQEMK
jgi:hypothetical protein